jgi:hypothetical protein
LHYLLLLSPFLFLHRTLRQVITTNEDGPQKDILSFNVGQGGSRNWAAGSEKFTLQAAAYLNYQANRKWRKNIWENSIDLSYALTNSSSTGFRKTDDKIDFRFYVQAYDFQKE